MDNQELEKIMIENSDDYVTVQQYAKLVGVSRVTAYDRIKNNKVEYIHVPKWNLRLINFKHEKKKELNKLLDSLGQEGEDLLQKILQEKQKNNNERNK